MVPLSAIVFGRWASRRSSLLRGHPGRTLTSSVSSARSAANVWITLSSLTSVTCAAYCRAIFNITMLLHTAHLSMSLMQIDLGVDFVVLRGPAGDYELGRRRAWLVRIG